MRIIILTAALVLTTLYAQAQRVNEKVKIESKGAWYDGKILKVNEADGTYYVQYDGWSDSWNEWVGIDRLKDYGQSSSLTKFKVGDKVEVEYGMVPAPATVIEVGENKYHIEFDKKAFGDKWVSEGQMKKL